MGDQTLDSQGDGEHTQSSFRGPSSSWSARERSRNSVNGLRNSAVGELADDLSRMEYKRLSMAPDYYGCDEDLSPPGRNEEADIGLFLVDERNVQKWIDVAPGLSLPILRKEETVQAFWENRILRMQCWTCEANLGYSERAHFVLCPACRCIMPATEGKDGPVCVGLGFTGKPHL